MTASETATRTSVANTSFSCMRQGSKPVTTYYDVMAQDGECLTSRAYGLAPDQQGFGSPQAAIRDHGFGQDPLTQVEPDPREAGLTFVEQSEGRVVGRYGVVQVESGGWVVVNLAASVFQ